MLTGPVTILNWSFPRKDASRRAQAFQLALALRAEVAALEAAGCRVVQVDEPALREGLPLKAAKWPSYLGWAVDAFRLCTAVAAPATQVVTHLCYSDFGDIMGPIIDMDGAQCAVCSVCVCEQCVCEQCVCEQRVCSVCV